MNILAKILNKILANQIQKGPITTLKLGSFEGFRDGSTYAKWKQKHSVITILAKRKTETESSFQ